MARLPKSIIKKYGITKKAWAVFRGRSKSRSKSKTKTTKKVKRMARRYRRKRRRVGKSLQTTAFKLIRIGALAGPGAYEFLVHGNDFKAGLGGAIGVYTGFDLNEGNFRWERLTRGWGPFLASIATTYGIPKLAGIIRRL